MNAEVSKYCAAKVAHRELSAKMKEALRDATVEKREVTQQLKEDMARDGVACVDVDGRYVMLDRSVRQRTTLDTVIASVRDLQAGDCLDPPRPRKPERLAVVVARAVRAQAKRRSTQTDDDTTQPRLKVLSAKPRSAIIHANPPTNIVRACQKLVGVTDKARNERRAWRNKLDVHNATMRDSTPLVLDHLNHVPGMRQELRVRRNDDDVASMTLVADEKEFVPAVGPRLMFAEIQRIVDCYAEEHELSLYHTTPSLPEGMTEHIVQQLEMWHAESSKQQRKMQLRVHNTHAVG